MKTDGDGNTVHDVDCESNTAPHGADCPVMLSARVPDGAHRTVDGAVHAIGDKPTRPAPGRELASEGETDMLFAANVSTFVILFSFRVLMPDPRRYLVSVSVWWFEKPAIC